jgi:hypothetical protein
MGDREGRESKESKERVLARLIVRKALILQTLKCGNHMREGVWKETAPKS